jgi:DNA modification methylase
MKKELEWVTEKRKVNDLIELEINPRKITEAKRQKLIDSLQKFNLAEIPAINTDNKVIAGNQRLKALQMAGRGEELIDVRVPNRKLTDKELKEYAIISNSHAGEWDFDILEMEFADIDLGDIGIDMKEIEFEQSDAYGKAQKTFFDRKEAALLKAEEDDFDVPDENTIKTDIVIGDLFEIGPHRLLCGDSTDSDSVAKLMNGEKADAVLTDPPYGQNQPGVDNDSPEAHKELLANAVKMLPIENAVVIAFNSPRTFPNWLTPCLDMEHKFERMLWLYKKAQNSYPYRGWLLTSEAILCSSKGIGNWNDVHPYKHDCYEVSEVSGELSVDIGWHGSVKPLLIVADLLNRISKENNICFDGFIGSGTTMVAAHQLNRKCYGIDLMPKNCQIIINRMLKLDSALIIKRNGELWTQN